MRRPPGKELYEPVERVPLPNSSRSTRERAVELRRAKDTWLRSIMNADWTFETDSLVDMRVKTIPGFVNCEDQWEASAKRVLLSTIPRVADSAGTKLGVSVKGKIRPWNITIRSGKEGSIMGYLAQKQGLYLRHILYQSNLNSRAHEIHLAS